jgi:hypothetical protein
MHMAQAMTMRRRRQVQRRVRNWLANWLFHMFLDLNSMRLRVLDPNLLPLHLMRLSCNNNALQALPPLPPTLQVLMCNGNQLTRLPRLPSVLYWLECARNPPLQHLPPLPAALLHLDCRECPRLTHLPERPERASVYCDARLRQECKRDQVNNWYCRRLHSADRVHTAKTLPVAALLYV